MIKSFESWAGLIFVNLVTGRYFLKTMIFNRFIAILLLLSGQIFVAQNNASSTQVTFAGIISDDMGNVSGANLQVTENGKAVTNVVSSAAGEYLFTIPFGGNFLIVVSKEGYVSKRFMVSTIGVPPDKQAEKFPTIKADIGLNKRYEGVDYSLLNQPINKFSYNPQRDNFEYDKPYLEQMLAGLNAIKDAEKAAKNRMKELEARYNAAVKEGDKNFGKKDWVTAVGNYQKALDIKPNEHYPKAQIENINKLSAEAAAMAKANSEAKEQADKAKRDADAIAAAEKLAKDNAEAQARAKRDAEAKARLIAENEAKSKAKADSEATITKSTAEAEAKAKAAFDAKKAADLLAAQSKADAEAKNKAEAEAKTKAEIEAKKAAELLAAQSKAEALAKASTASKGNATPEPTTADSPKAKVEAVSYNSPKYLEAIKNADNFFGLKRYRDAKKYYEEALTFKGGDPYAMGKVIECEKFLNSDASTLTDERVKQLLAKYAPGVTEETITGPGVVILQRVVVKDNWAWVYQKKMFSWGGISFFRDATPIIESTFEIETKP
jgi:hypothetical protein